MQQHWESGSLSESEEKKDSSMKRKKLIIIIVAVAALAAACIAVFVLKEMKDSKNSSANVVAWDVDIEEDELPETDEILIPGYDSMTMAANTKEQAVSMGNPADNNCYFVIILKLEDGTKLYESEYLKPGEGLNEITMEQELEPGEYQAIIEYKCYSLEDKSSLNGGSAQFNLIVK